MDTGKIGKRTTIRLTRREFRLIAALLVMLECFLTASYLVLPQWYRYREIADNVSSTRILVDTLGKEYSKKSQFEEEDKLLVYKIEKLKTGLPTSLSQEQVLLDLTSFSKSSGLELGAISFEEIKTSDVQGFLKQVNTVPSSEDLLGQASILPAQSAASPVQQSASGGTADSTGGNAAAGNSGGTASAGTGKSAAPTGPVVYSENINLSFSGDYAALYKFLSAVEKSARKVYPRNIAISRGAGGKLQGTMQLLYTAYWSPGDAVSDGIDVPKDPGKSNIFKAYAGYDDGTGAVQTTSVPTVQTQKNPDFYMLLNTYDDNAPKVILGQYPKTETEIYADVNETVRGRLVIGEADGAVTYQYSLKDETRGGKLQPASSDGTLRLQVVSQARKSDQDKTGITLDVENNTTRPLEITVIHDDTGSPRFKLGAGKGNVTVKQQ